MRPFRAYRFSRPAHSTALPLLRIVGGSVSIPPNVVKSRIYQAFRGRLVQPYYHLRVDLKVRLSLKKSDEIRGEVANWVTRFFLL
jgi:hypothetical protein